MNPPPPTNPEWTIGKLLSWVTDHFKTNRIDSPRTTAEILLAHALGLPRINLYTQYDKPLNNHELAGFKPLIKRRLNHEPVAYIVGTKGFWTLDLAVSRDVLIPRPETERLVETALTALTEDLGLEGAGSPGRVLDLGTGSGAVVLALASERPEYDFFASDISPAALKVARNNARDNGLLDRVRFFAGRWFCPLSSKGPPFHQIVSNPPYIPCLDIAGLQPEICRFEPKIALDGDGDGLACLRRIIRDAPDYLVPRGHLMLEIGHDQKSAVEGIIDASGRYETVRFVKDHQGIDRVAHVRKRA